MQETLAMWLQRNTDMNADNSWQIHHQHLQWPVEPGQEEGRAQSVPFCPPQTSENCAAKRKCNQSRCSVGKCSPMGYEEGCVHTSPRKASAAGHGGPLPRGDLKTSPEAHRELGSLVILCQVQHLLFFIKTVLHKRGCTNEAGLGFKLYLFFSFFTMCILNHLECFKKHNFSSLTSADYDLVNW